MEEIINKIQCSNINCLVFNPLDNNFCHKCGTPILRRYLYVYDHPMDGYNSGDLIDDRYLVQKDNIVLDTKSGLPPELTEDLPSDIVSYLKLFPYRLHIPQIYGFITTAEKKQIWLLEHSKTTHQSPLQLFTMTEIWPYASPMRQLNWLWQLASLWQPLSDERVAETLIKPSLIFVQNSIIKIKKLHSKSNQKIPLMFLGHFWSTLILTAHPSLKNILKNICQAIISRKIIDSKELIKILDQVIAEYAKTKEYNYQICAYTDVGKTRQNNEDACYPNSPSYLKIEPEKKAFAIVCDGIGGHEGGEVASQMAIAFLEEELSKISSSEEKFTPEEIQDKLRQLVCEVNDLISERNNAEERFQQRQRMGTTIVLAFAYQYEIYFIHVGDSRIYLINQQDCQQLTVDDDLASRQVRLGYSIYRDALLYPGAGALIQALGMNQSISLFPTSQRYLIDEDSVFLLCSDGLSDFDRVEQYWEQEILPILTEQKDLSAAGQKLIEIANQTNGHDNITIALIHCQITSKSETENLFFDWKNLISQLENLPIQEEEILIYPDESAQEQIQPEESSVKTKRIARRKKKRKSPSNMDLFLIIFIILGSIYLVYAWIVQPFLNKLKPENNLKIGQIIKIKNKILLYPHYSSENNPNDQDGVGEIPERSILQVIGRNEEISSLNLKICQIFANGNSLSLQKGESGWIGINNIFGKIDLSFEADSVDQSWCENEVDLAIGDIIKIIEPITRLGEELLEIKPETFLKVREVSENKLSIKLTICHLQTDDNNQIFINKDVIIPTQEISNKFEKMNPNINYPELENTSCYSDDMIEVPVNDNNQ